MIKKIFYLFFLAILSLIPFAIRYQVWNINFLMPFAYDGDIMWNLVSIKGIIEKGWYLTNNSLGAPFNYSIIDYPVSELFHFLLIKFLSLFISNPSLILNIFYIFTFVSTFITSFFVFRHFKIRAGLAIVGAYLFTYLPFHLIRGENHMFLSSYFMIPPIVMVISWIMDKETIFFKNIFEKKSILTVIIALLISSTGIYYAFFSVVFILFAGLIGSIQNGRLRNIFAAIVVSLIISSGILINIYPNLIHQISYGGSQAVGRSPTEAEYYGLKIIGFFIPNSSYHLPLLRKFQVKYMTYALTKDEGGTSYLGAFGVIGFLILLFNLIKKIKIDPKLDNLSYLNLWGVLFATVSGFAIFFTYIVSENIRVYQRISIFIAFFSIFGFILTLNNIFSKIKLAKHIYFIILLIIIFVGLVDLTSVYIPEPRSLYPAFLSDKKFVEQIELSVNDEAMIFQLPYKAFPETPPIHNLGDYALFRPYLHSHTLKWSYGVIKGSSHDQWIKSLSELPVEEMIDKVTVAGYKGIYLNTAGYIDGGEQMGKKLFSVLNQKPIISDTKDHVFYNLINYRRKLIKEYSQEAMDKQQKEVLSLPIAFNWNKGFYPEETDKLDFWRWSKKRSSLTLVNDNPENINITLSFDFMSNYPEYTNLIISSKLFNSELKMNSIKKKFNKKIILPKGPFQIKFETDSKKAISSTDPRELYFRIFNFKVE